MFHPCDKPCGNKTASGYCATTACINPQYSNLGTAQYGKGVQKRIITNADKIRAMSDEELAEWLKTIVQSKSIPIAFVDGELIENWLDWLKEVSE